MINEPEQHAVGYIWSALIATNGTARLTLARLSIVPPTGRRIGTGLQAHLPILISAKAGLYITG